MINKVTCSLSLSLSLSLSHIYTHTSTLTNWLTIYRNLSATLAHCNSISNSLHAFTYTHSHAGTHTRALFSDFRSTQKHLLSIFLHFTPFSKPSAKNRFVEIKIKDGSANLVLAIVSLERADTWSSKSCRNSIEKSTMAGQLVVE